MPTGVVLDIARAAVTTAFLLAAPLLAVAMTVGLMVSIIQAVTSIQEQTLSFVPKLIAVGAVFLLLFSWMLQIMMSFTLDLFRSLPTLVG